MIPEVKDGLSKLLKETYFVDLTGLTTSENQKQIPIMLCDVLLQNQTESDCIECRILIFSKE